jgi:DNA mismatch endonuclease (patch repair protein)
MANREWWRHKLQTNTNRDRRNDEQLRSAGWTVLRIWEHQPVTDAADRVQTLVLAARSS